MSIVKFETEEIEFKNETDGFYVSGVDLCKALGYANPQKSEQVTFGRHKSLFEPRIVKYQFDTKPIVGGRPKIHRYYDQVGATLLIMKSETEKAEALQIFIAECFVKFINGESKPSNISNSTEIILNNMKQNVLLLEEVLDKQNQLEVRVNNIEDKIDIEKQDFCLSPSERKETARLIRKWSFIEHKKNPNHDFSDIIKKCWNKLNYQFDVSHYNDILSKRFPEILIYLNRKFRKAKPLDLFIEEIQ